MTDEKVDEDDGLPEGIPALANELKSARSSNVLFGVVVLVIMAILIGVSAHEARLASKRVDDATECIIEQFSEHREANAAAHQAFSKKVGAPYEELAANQSPDILDRLETACEPFTK